VEKRSASHLMQCKKEGAAWPRWVNPRQMRGGRGFTAMRSVTCHLKMKPLIGGGGRVVSWGRELHGNGVAALLAK